MRLIYPSLLAALCLAATASNAQNVSGPKSVQLTVYNANRAPVIVPWGNQSVARGDVLEIPLGITDPDGNPLVITTEGLPRFAEIRTLDDGSRVLRIAPGAQDRGDYVVTLTATDDGDGGGVRMRQSASYTFVITAESPSEAPVKRTVYVPACV